MNQLHLRTHVNRKEGEQDAFLVTEVQVDGTALVDFDHFALGADLYQLQRSITETGEFFLVTCWCGIAECAGIRQGIQVRRDSKHVLWAVRGLPPKGRPTR